LDSLDDYQIAALVTAKPDIDLLVMSALGIGGEAGEYIELVKKHRFHHKPLNAEDAKSELGDVLWYVAAAAAANGMTLSEVAEYNIAKLRARHG